MSQKRILHIVDDEKFVDAAYSWAEKTIPGICDFVVISEHSNLKYINKTPVNIFQKKKLFKILTVAKNYEAAIIHKLDFTKIWLLFFASKNIQFIWIGLGGDYYKYIFPNKEKMLMPLTKSLFKEKNNYQRISIKEKFYQSFIVKKAINKIKYFAPVIEDDYHLLTKKAQWFKPAYVNFNYGSGINKINELLDSDPIHGNSILIGNSATYENNHLDFFDKIKTYSLGGFDIICPLSYGRDEYKVSILKAGKDLFGSKFRGLSDFISFESYSKLISNCSIVVMNHKRQQALGNINLMLTMGAKIYLREESPVYSYLKRLGYVVYAINEIEDEVDFLKKLSKEDIENNRKIMRERNFQDEFKEKIKHFYETILS